MVKKKMPFIRLSIAFLLIITAAIFYSWGYNDVNKSDAGMMMDQSMGEMMGENHLKDITIRDLIRQEENNDTEQSSDNQAEHHDTGVNLLTMLHRITTITIVALIPFIIAGTIFLMIIWFDKT